VTLRCLVGPHPCGTALDTEALDTLYTHPPGVLRAGMIAGLDGAIELGGRSGGLGGEDDQELLATLRAAADVVVIGSGTLRQEGYGPVWLSEERRRRRVERGQAPLPALAVVSTRGDLDPAARVFTERRDNQPEPPKPIVFTADGAGGGPLADVAEIVPAGSSAVEVSSVLDRLAERGLRRVLCEGGPTLLGAFAAAGVLGELCLSKAPVYAGPGHATLGGSGRPFERPLRLRLAHLLVADDGLLAGRYLSDG
jgi:riboflavin biosynthesis pyrimidine reductase